MNSMQNKWDYRKFEHRFYAEIVSDTTTKNVKTHSYLYILPVNKILTYLLNVIFSLKEDAVDLLDPNL